MLAKSALVRTDARTGAVALEWHDGTPITRQALARGKERVRGHRKYRCILLKFPKNTGEIP